MTEQLARTMRRVESVRQLETVVNAMRAISASRIQQAQSLMRGLHAHSAVIGAAIGQALALLPAPQRPAATHTRRNAVVLFCAEQGFAGGFSDRVLEAVGSGEVLFLIGTRGVALAKERNVPLHWQTAMVPRADLIPLLANRIARAFYNWLLGQRDCRVDLVVPTWSPSGGVVSTRRSLLPFDFDRFEVRAMEQAPLVTLPPTLLLDRLAEEYIFAELCDAALIAFMAENEARIATMLAAKSNLETMLGDLEALERQFRQEEITAEINELASATAI